MNIFRRKRRQRKLLQRQQQEQANQIRSKLIWNDFRPEDTSINVCSEYHNRLGGSTLFYASPEVVDNSAFHGSRKNGTDGEKRLKRRSFLGFFFPEKNSPKINTSRFDLQDRRVSRSIPFIADRQWDTYSSDDSSCSDSDDTLASSKEGSLPPEIPPRNHSLRTQSVTPMQGNRGTSMLLRNGCSSSNGVYNVGVNGVGGGGGGSSSNNNSGNNNNISACYAPYPGYYNEAAGCSTASTGDGAVLNGNGAVMSFAPPPNTLSHSYSCPLLRPPAPAVPTMHKDNASPLLHSSVASSISPLAQPSDENANFYIAQIPYTPAASIAMTPDSSDTCGDSPYPLTCYSSIDLSSTSPQFQIPKAPKPAYISQQPTDVGPFTSSGHGYTSPAAMSTSILSNLAGLDALQKPRRRQLSLNASLHSSLPSLFRSSQGSLPSIFKSSQEMLSRYSESSFTDKEGRSSSRSKLNWSSGRRRASRQPTLAEQAKLDAWAADSDDLSVYEYANGLFGIPLMVSDTNMQKPANEQATKHNGTPSSRLSSSETVVEGEQLSAEQCKRVFLASTRKLRSNDNLRKDVRWMMLVKNAMARASNQHASVTGRQFKDNYNVNPIADDIYYMTGDDRYWPRRRKQNQDILNCDGPGVKIPDGEIDIPPGVFDYISGAMAVPISNGVQRPDMVNDTGLWIKSPRGSPSAPTNKSNGSSSGSPNGKRECRVQQRSDSRALAKKTSMEFGSSRSPSWGPQCALEGDQADDDYSRLMTENSRSLVSLNPVDGYDQEWGVSPVPSMSMPMCIPPRRRRGKRRSSTIPINVY